MTPIIKKMTWKELIADAMKRRGFSIRSLAKECQISPTTVRNFKEGGNVRIGTFAIIARQLDLAITVEMDPVRFPNEAPK